MGILLGAIADDFTGATDLAGTLVNEGMRTIQTINVPAADLSVENVDAVVVALKSRTIPPDYAIERSVEALKWLQQRGCRQYLFKYCSTFDSTDKGNIGPVAEALLDALGADFTIACPAFPTNLRTIYNGYLFVGDVLLSESGMKDHPLTPMRDANLVRVLGRQSRAKVGLVPFKSVRRGARAIADEIGRLRKDGFRLAIVDAISDDDLRAVDEAAADLALITGGSGIAIGLPENYRRRGLLSADVRADALPQAGGKAAVIAGSCSEATRGQVRFMKDRVPALQLKALDLARDRSALNGAHQWLRTHLADDGPVLVYATAEPEEVGAAQAELGAERAGTLVEEALASVASELVANGVRRLVVAGGETSGAVVNALGVTALRIGPEIDPGVPWTVSLSDPPVALALKSGNFGTEDFFVKAFGRVS